MKAGLAALADQLEITANAVLREYAKVGFAAVKEGDIKPSDKLTALTQLGEHLGLVEDGTAFLPPAGQGTGEGGNQFQKYNLLSISQEDAARMYQEVIRNTHRLAAQQRADLAKPMTGQRVR